MATALTLIWGPRYDLAWTREQVVWVAQVKSISQTEERQLRTAAGHVLRYRQKLIANGHEVQAVIITSRPPSDASWDDLCEWEGSSLRGRTSPRNGCLPTSVSQSADVGHLIMAAVIEEGGEPTCPNSRAWR